MFLVKSRQTFLKNPYKLLSDWDLFLDTVECLEALLGAAVRYVIIFPNFSTVVIMVLLDSK